MDDAPTSHQPESAEGPEGADEVMDEAVEEEEEEEEEEEKQRVRLVSIRAPSSPRNVLTRIGSFPAQHHRQPPSSFYRKAILLVTR